MKTFKKYISEGVNDPAIFKAVFLAGGPGSGKSFIVGKTALTALGFRVINSDSAFEAALAKAGLEATPENIYSPIGQELRGRAKLLTKKKMDLALQGRLGLVIDGTGKDYDKIQRQANKLRELGYEVSMIFVNTDLDTALERNRMRSRSLPDSVVEEMWKDVQKNLGKFQNFFRQKMFIVDNSTGSNYEGAVLSTYKQIMKWSKQKPETTAARDWIKAQKQLGEETITVPKKKNTLGVRRIDMPQVKAKYMQDFLQYMRKNEAKVEKLEVDPKQLKAIQGEFDKEKIAANIEKMKQSPLKPIIISKDGYVVDGNHRWLAAMNAGVKIPAYRISIKGMKLLNLTNKYPKVVNKAVGESFDIYEILDLICESDETCPVITRDHMKAFEKFVDRLFDKFGIDFEFTKHFRDRMSDERNKPCIDMKELAAIIQKIYKRKSSGQNLLGKHADSEVVLKDIQSDLNMPIAIKYDRKNDDLTVVAKTIMRKKNFRTPNPVVNV